MAERIVIPREGQGMDTATIISWSVSIGDTVSFGDELCEVESEKATFPIESAVSGTILAILYEAGVVAPVLTTIAVIGKPGEDFSELLADSSEKTRDDIADTTAAIPIPATTVIEFQNIESVPSSVESDTSTHNNGVPTRRRISPRAAKLAQKNRINLDAIDVDPIHEKDVAAYIAATANATLAARDLLRTGSTDIPAKGTAIGGRISLNDIQDSTGLSGETPLTGKQKVIARNMLESVQSSAQFTLSRHVDVTNLLRFKQSISESELSDEKITINDILLFVVSRTLIDFPQLNAQFTDEVYFVFDHVNLGFAVDVPDGLVVPVIKETGRLGLRDIARMTKNLVSECRAGTISSDQMSDGSFTVSNLGSMEIESFAPILNYPQVAILGIGGIFPRAMRIEEKIVHRDCIHLSLTLNHQVVDGATGARFLQQLARNLTSIEVMLLK